MAIVGQFNSLIAVAFRMAVWPGLPHQGHSNSAPVQQVEVAVRGGFLGEWRLPRRIEVDSVGEDESGQIVDGPLRNQVFYAAFGLVADPLVDSVAGRLRRSHKIQSPEPCPVVLGKNVKVLLKELVVLMAPDGVDDTQSEPFPILALCPLTALGQLKVKGV